MKTLVLQAALRTGDDDVATKIAAAAFGAMGYPEELFLYIPACISAPTYKSFNVYIVAKALFEGTCHCNTR